MVNFRAPKAPASSSIYEIAKGTPPPNKQTKFDPSIPLESLTSLERVERMVALGMDESEIAGEAGSDAASAADFPTWNRGLLARAARRVLLARIPFAADSDIRAYTIRGSAESGRIGPRR